MSVRILAVGIVFLLVAVRAVTDYRLMHEYGADAQMSIWFMYMAAKILLWLIFGLAAVALIDAGQMKSRRSIVGCLLLVLWVATIGWSSFAYHQARHALVAASSTKTSPERLKTLSHITGIQASYELDNRLAQNPNTPPEVLRQLHGKPYQIGTEIALAQNPNTPDDVLLEIAARKDEWSEHLQTALKNNPKYNVLFPEGTAGADTQQEKGNKNNAR